MNLPLLLFVVAVVLIVLAFAHVVGLLVGLGGALICLIVAVALGGAAAGWRGS